ncbi:MAG TPA: hypothetical protein VLE20_11455 [Blastocatellia bacterium]|nr:hypothetical protein [Blastocatellia bacterium]
MRTSGIIFIILLLGFAAPPAVTTNEAQPKLRDNIPAVLWEDPGEIRSRDLYHGSGARELAPAPPFDFLEEDKQGASPKFMVKDARGVKWSVKMGPEAQAEVTATRLVWAVGYSTEETYYFARVRINNLPRLSRGERYVENGGVVRGVRFEARRPEVERAETWSWAKNPFAATQELDGLRVLMIMLNSYDPKTSNNRVFIVYDPQDRRREARYVVADLGASLGRVGGIGAKRSKNNVEDFVSSRFVLGVEDGMVRFDYDVGLKGFGWATIAYPPGFRKLREKGRAMQDIPVPHAVWIGGHLARLTTEQLHDAFRAANYDRATATAYVKTLQKRIRQLTRLSTHEVAETPR